MKYISNTTWFPHKKWLLHVFVSNVWLSKFLYAWKYIALRHQCSATTKWLSPIQMSNLNGNFENEILDYPHFSANFLKFSFFMTFTSLMTLSFNIRSPKISMALNFNIMSEITPVSKCKSNYRISIYLSIKTHVFKLRFS